MVDTSSFGSYEPIMPLSSSVQKPQEALLFTLSNPAMTVRLTDLGAAIVGIDVPDLPTCLHGIELEDCVDD